MAKINEKKDLALLDGGVTQPQIDGWKAAHSDVFKITVKDVRGDVVGYGYFKKPTRDVISSVVKHQKSDPVKANEILMANTWLGGDEILQTNDSHFMTTCTELQAILEIGTAELVKL